MDEPNANNVVEMLDKLSKLRLNRNALLLKKQDLINEIMTEEIKERLAKIEKQFESKNSKMADEINTLETDIRGRVKSIGSTVKGFSLMAVWQKASVKWDTQALEGYAAGGHQEILQFRKEGEPSVSIREIK